MRATKCREARKVFSGSSRDSSFVHTQLIFPVRVTQMLRQGDAQVMKKYSQMKLQMKREALEKINRSAGEAARAPAERMCTVMVQ